MIYKISLNQKEYDLLCEELSSLYNYHWNSDHIHANDCGSKSLPIIEVNQNPEEYILCAAIHFDDGKSYTQQPKNIKLGLVICGRRHDNCYQVFSLIRIDKYITTHGFLTNTDRFVTRKEAFYIAWKARQIYVDESKPIRDPIVGQSDQPISLGKLISDNTITASLVSEDLY
jgi:hypothetical protein